MRLKKMISPLLSLVFLSTPLLAELKYFPKDKAELLELVKNEKIKLDEIDTSKIKDMSYLFCQAQNTSHSHPYVDSCEKTNRWIFEGIETWDVSNVENMEGMFLGNEYFHESIENWNVSKVKNMSYMFADAKSFNQPIEKWDVSNVENMYSMFENAISFNQPLDNWNVSKVKDMYHMFYRATSFNQPLNSWNVSNVKDTSFIFDNAISFNQNLDSWGDKNPFKKNHGKNPDYNPYPQVKQKKVESVFRVNNIDICQYHSLLEKLLGQSPCEKRIIK